LARPRQRRVAGVTLNLRSESGASHQQHGKETASENVERKAEAGPPNWDTGIPNNPVMKEVENSVSGEGSHNQPKVLLEACHGQPEKSACYQGVPGELVRCQDSAQCHIVTAKQNNNSPTTGYRDPYFDRHFPAQIRVTD